MAVTCCKEHTMHIKVAASYAFCRAVPLNMQDHIAQDGDGFLTAEELTKGLKDCDIFANVDDIMQVCCAQRPTAAVRTGD